MEYNLLLQILALTIRLATTTSLQIWHYQLGHCRPEVSQHFMDSRDVISVTDNYALATHECETCAVSKAY